MEGKIMMWRKSSYSLNQGNCVEAGSDAGNVLVRDTTNRGGVTLVVSAAAWNKFVATVLQLM